ncbi:hypothetical protein BH20ACI2_BH20ACI2_25640 [soil metagenome]
MLLLAKYKPFFVGFLVVLICFTIVFVVDYRLKFDGLCMDCDNDFGWPFKVYKSGGLVHATKILWSGVIANTLATLISAAVFGSVCQTVWTRKSHNGDAGVR